MGVKRFKTYDELVDVLASRGMDVGDRTAAVAQLHKVNYYRLSGYWYPFRRQISATERSDQFYKGTTLVDVTKLYQFDARLRSATFDALAPVELSLRAALGHALGELDECAHLRPDLLGPRARKGSSYDKWRRGYEVELSRSREDFIAHHQVRYGGTLPVWVAVEILDWGSLTYLFGYSPRKIQDDLADVFGLSAPQLESWMRCLNVVRNVCAHHGRLFNRVYAITPKLPRVGHLPDLDTVRSGMNRTFGQLSLVQHMLVRSGNGSSKALSAVLRSYPQEVSTVPLSHTGAPRAWQSSGLWCT
ncbi:abortive infection bacteriophage resistance protein [Tamaricihabitans halophyticus]|uniref:Abortive infection bacteriophage resistance protein n=1 Tax=Tamaricihabitans halophyticus TaxID=1262583 RepID=A0A4R2R3R3_9PSEU|nr:Abi family protein [Tamaricihabitans halophyticus]TCP56268.1 abortive infection bacteriophage resistance protein [Tamaricihabitans halophyticus]